MLLGPPDLEGAAWRVVMLLRRGGRATAERVASELLLLERVAAGGFDHGSPRDALQKPLPDPVWRALIQLARGQGRSGDAMGAIHCLVRGSPVRARQAAGYDGLPPAILRHLLYDAPHAPLHRAWAVGAARALLESAPADAAEALLGGGGGEWFAPAVAAVAAARPGGAGAPLALAAHAAEPAAAASRRLQEAGDAANSAGAAAAALDVLLLVMTHREVPSRHVEAVARQLADHGVFMRALPDMLTLPPSPRAEEAARKLLRVLSRAAGHAPWLPAAAAEAGGEGVFMALQRRACAPAGGEAAAQDARRHADELATAMARHPAVQRALPRILAAQAAADGDGGVAGIMWLLDRSPELEEQLMAVAAGGGAGGGALATALSRHSAEVERRSSIDRGRLGRGGAGGAGSFGGGRRVAGALAAWGRPEAHAEPPRPRPLPLALAQPASALPPRPRQAVQPLSQQLWIVSQNSDSADEEETEQHLQPIMPPPTLLSQQQQQQQQQQEEEEQKQEQQQQEGQPPLRQPEQQRQRLEQQQEQQQHHSYYRYHIQQDDDEQEEQQLEGQQTRFPDASLEKQAAAAPLVAPLSAAAPQGPTSSFDISPPMPATPSQGSGPHSDEALPTLGACGEAEAEGPPEPAAAPGGEGRLQVRQLLRVVMQHAEDQGGEALEGAVAALRRMLSQGPPDAGFVTDAVRGTPGAVPSLLHLVSSMHPALESDALALLSAAILPPPAAHAAGGEAAGRAAAAGAGGDGCAEAAHALLGAEGGALALLGVLCLYPETVLPPRGSTAAAATEEPDAVDSGGEPSPAPIIERALAILRHLEARFPAELSASLGADTAAALHAASALLYSREPAVWALGGRMLALLLAVGGGGSSGGGAAAARHAAGPAAVVSAMNWCAANAAPPPGEPGPPTGAGGAAAGGGGFSSNHSFYGAGGAGGGVGGSAFAANGSGAFAVRGRGGAGGSNWVGSSFSGGFSTFGAGSSFSSFGGGGRRNAAFAAANRRASFSVDAEEEGAGAGGAGAAAGARAPASRYAFGSAGGAAFGAFRSGGAAFSTGAAGAARRSFSFSPGGGLARGALGGGAGAGLLLELASGCLAAYVRRLRRQGVQAYLGIVTPQLMLTGMDRARSHNLGRTPDPAAAAAARAGEADRTAAALLSVAARLVSAGAVAPEQACATPGLLRALGGLLQLQLPHAAAAAAVGPGALPSCEGALQLLEAVARHGSRVTVAALVFRAPGLTASIEAAAAPAIAAAAAAARLRRAAKAAPGDGRQQQEPASPRAAAAALAALPKPPPLAAAARRLLAQVRRDFEDILGAGQSDGEGDGDGESAYDYSLSSDQGGADSAGSYGGAEDSMGPAEVCFVCGKGEAEGVRLRPCSGCMKPGLRLCSKVCSMEAWRAGHRDECEKLQQQRAQRVEAAERGAADLAARAAAS